MPEKCLTVPKSREISKKDLHKILKEKLKLDKNIIGLLVNSEGSIKSKSFFEKVSDKITGK